MPVSRRAVALLALAMSASACSGGSSQATPTVSPTVSATPFEVATTSPPVAVTTASPSSSPAPTRTPKPATGTESPAPLGQPTCAAAAVTVTDADTLTTPSYRREVFSLRTTGKPCQLEGYPKVILLGADGRSLNVRSTQGGAGLPAEKPVAYTLTTATSLSFEVSSARNGSCVDAHAARITLPGTTTGKEVPTDTRVCGTVVAISPVHRAGDDE